MAKSKKKNKNKKRRSMGGGTRRAAQAAKTGVAYLNIPKGIKLFKEEADKRYNLDILPYVVKDSSKHPDGQYIEDIWWRLPLKVHKNIGPDKKDIICPRTIGKKCRICEDQRKLYEDPHGDEEVAKLLRAKDRVLYLVKPIKSKDFSDETYLWEISYHNFGKCLDKELEYEEDCVGFADLEGGFTLRSRFIEAQIGTFKFPQCDRIDFKPRDDYDEDILDDLPDLLDCIIVLSDKEISKIYTGIDDVSGYDNNKDDEDEDEDDDSDDYENDDEDDSDEDESEDEGDDEEDEITANDINEMNKKELNAVVKENKLKITAKTKKKVKDYREAVIEELGLDEDESEDEDDEDTDNECPHGYVFGGDNAEHDECSDCDVYDDCLEHWTRT